ncbi:MAG: hypothetical protein ACRENU_11235 [Gemmatimonadaceae bacterium]
MYSTCLFCNNDLGKNEVIEQFPIGRRLAYDAAKGRLWVVCRKCERWNLTPLEERWEAIEEAERLFSATRLRVSTDNIGLAKLREGLELVRIGSALRPELAAWRYGDQFGRRRQRHLLLSAASVAAVGGILILGPGTGIIAGGGWGMWQGMNALHTAYQNRRTRLKLKLPGEGTLVTLRKKHLEHTTLTRETEGGWILNLSYDPRDKWGFGGKPYEMIPIRGEQAIRVAGQVLPKINASGAKAREVQDAVRLLEPHRDPFEFFAREARMTPRGRRSTGQAERIHKFPIEVRLALEMAAHEEQERRALEGELALLEAAWRDAEEVANIADDLLLPESAVSRFEQLKTEG